MSLTDWHAFEDSVRWRLVPSGVEIEGSGVERTRGAPVTAGRVWNAYAEAINRVARDYRVPCALIVATICTESAGRADAVREEPGYTSDEATPHRISAGLMQTLISTARHTLQLSLDRAWLLKPENSIRAGTAYIAKQAKLTSLDPPLVAAAYNAGRLAHQTGSANRWKLRQYPIGTGKHCDRFVQFFNDAVFVLSDHSIRPSVGIDSLVGSQPARTRQPDAASSSKPEVRIDFGENADPRALTPYSRSVLEDILRAAKLDRAVISSTARDPANQARVMFNNLERYGVEHQKQLYGRAGDQVIDQYAASKGAGKTSDQIKADMEQKIKDIGPVNVSRHAADPRKLNVFDVAPSSIRDKHAFERAVGADARVKTFLTPPKDPGYHLEIPQQE